MRRNAALMFACVALSTSITACTPGLTPMVTEAMDGCIAARNPVFTSGRGADALKTPLPEKTEVLAMRLRYQRATNRLQGIATSARDQVTLVCALDLMTHTDDADVRRFVEGYLKHPSPDVASNARLLLDRPAPKGL